MGATHIHGTAKPPGSSKADDTKHKRNHRTKRENGYD